MVDPPKRKLDGLKEDCDERMTKLQRCGEIHEVASCRRKLEPKISCESLEPAENATLKCGHNIYSATWLEKETRVECREIVSVKLPTCGHVASVPCHVNTFLSMWQPWRAMTSSIQVLHNESVVEDNLLPPRSLPVDLRPLLNDCVASVRFRRATTCGHEMEMKCHEAFQILQGQQTQSPCAVEVVKRLTCGHGVTMKCFEELDGNTQCTELVDKLCWNFAVCGNKVTMFCTESSGSVQCTKETQWLCSKGHSFSLQLCSIGVPSDCPRCSIDSLDAAIKGIRRIMNSKNVNLWAPEEARILPGMNGVTQIAMSLPSKRDFLTRKYKLLTRFKEGLSESSMWSNALFSPLEFPVFVVLSRKLQAVHIDKFEMKDFGSLQTLNGMKVYEATQENFNRVVGPGKPTILFGQLYTVKHLTNPVDLPKLKGKKSVNWRKWATRQEAHGYDALYRDANSGKEEGSWIVWEPHVLFPVHRVEISEANREAIVNCLPEKTQVKQTPLLISFTRQFAVVCAGKVSSDAPMHATPVISVEILNKLQKVVGSVSPSYENLNVWCPWDGRTLFTSDSEIISPLMKNSLVSNLRCIPSKVSVTKEQLTTNPFGGVKYLKNVQSQGILKAEGNLFLALELLTVRKQDTQEARMKLEEYVGRVCNEERGYAHPLVIVAISRLAGRLSLSPDIQRKLLEIFATLYPEASSLWLSDGEAKVVQPAVSGDTVVIVEPTSVETKWNNLKTRWGCRSEAMEDLLKLVGLKKVKQAAVNLFKNALALQRMAPEQRKKNTMAFNYCFVGNPGTGKTTVARLFAKVLNDSQIRLTSTVVECTGQKLKANGANIFHSQIDQAVGGVLFIDEAYELNPVGDSKGRPIVAELLTAAEDKRDRLSIILAGYEDDLQEKLFAYNDGLQSRFIEVTFEDFDAHELEIIWDGLAQDRGWEYEKSIVKAACRRLAKASGTNGFGNARAVRMLFEQAVKEALARDDFDGTLKFQTVDLLGDRPSTNPKVQLILTEVEEKIGWRKIKEEMKKLVRISDENYARELKGQETVPLCLNRLFLGNPGTGKTTCAGYYGRLLKVLHFLSNGEVVKKTAGDFVGCHIGDPQTKTSLILEMAKGKVLVIDEAYNLKNSTFGTQALDVLVEKVHGTEGDDLAVLLIGYEHEMLEMLRTQNPGLIRRFPPQYAFHFEDYTEHELLDILEWNCAKRSVTCPYDVAEALLKQLALQKTQPNFGNAGAVEQLLKHALGKAVSRPMVNGMTVLTLEDVGGEVKSEDQKDPIKLLDKLYRMEEIKEQLVQLRNQMIVADREGSGVPEVGHFVFRGSPGTGKTTVARVMAEILHGMGVLATTKLVETSGLDLTGEYLGQTKKKVTDKLSEAKGGLLFIDEAYELGKGMYGEEAMTSLVAAMTDPSYAGMVIIIAGYSKDVDQMLDRNAGLKSRFTRFIDFPDWEAQDAVVFLSEKAETENFEVESDAVFSLQTTFVELKKLNGFGNGRDAMRVWKELVLCRAQRVINAPEVFRTITAKDATKAGDRILASRRPPSGPMLSTSSLPKDTSMLQAQGYGPRTQESLSELTQQHEAEEKLVEELLEGKEPTSAVEEEACEMDDADEDEKLTNEERDVGVSDEDWEELERAKEAHAAHLKDLQRAHNQNKVEEERRRAAAIQEKIRRICPCPAGFNWYKCGGGWRCSAGGHFVSDAQLNSQFTC